MWGGWGGLGVEGQGGGGGRGWAREGQCSSPGPFLSCWQAGARAGRMHLTLAPGQRCSNQQQREAWYHAPHRDARQQAPGCSSVLTAQPSPAPDARRARGSGRPENKRDTPQTQATKEVLTAPPSPAPGARQTASRTRPAPPAAWRRLPPRIPAPSGPARSSPARRRCCSTGGGQVRGRRARSSE